VACTTDRVELDLDDMGWVPKPAELPDAVVPEVTVEDGWTPSSATIRVGWGFVSIGLPATIVDGQLRIDSTGLGFGIGDEIDPWVDAFNSTLEANGKQLDSFDVRDGKVTMTKRPIPAAGTDTAAEVAAVTSAVAATGPEVEEPARKKTGCLAWIIGAVVAVAAAVGVVLAMNGSDDNNSVSTGESEPAASSPASSSTTSTTSSTISQVGQVPDEAEADATAVACGAFEDLGFGDLSEVFDGDLDGYMMIGGNCNSIDGAYLPTNYDNDSDPDLLLAGSAPGWRHTQSPPDSFTGESGPSTALERIFYGRADTDLPFIAIITSDCGGQAMSGSSVFGPDRTALAEHRLVNFGPCQVVDLGVLINPGTDDQRLITVPPRSLESGGAFDVGSKERAAGPLALDLYPQFTGPNPIAPGWSAPVQTIGSALGGVEPTGPGCSLLFEPGAVHGSTLNFTRDGAPDCNGRFWVFAAALTDVEVDLVVEDTVTAHFGTYVNPLGDPLSAVADTIDLPPVTALFDGRDGTPDTAIFPCGSGHLAFTVCPADEQPMDSGAFVSVGIAAGGPIPTMWDGTPRSYTVDFDHVSATALLEEAGWTASTTDGSPVRAMIRDNSLTFVLPQDVVDSPTIEQDEVSYELTTDIDGVVITQPAVPVVGLTTSPPSIVEVEPEPAGGAEEEATPIGATESLDDFYAQLSASLSAGDVGFSFDRLAPTVLEVYPTQCPAALESFADPELLIEPLAEGLVGPWTWVLPDGRSYEIPNATEVTVVLTGRGQSGTESEAHLELIDGEYHWFTLCE